MSVFDGLLSLVVVPGSLAVEIARAMVLMLLAALASALLLLVWAYRRFTGHRYSGPEAVERFNRPRQAMGAAASRPRQAA